MYGVKRACVRRGLEVLAALVLLVVLTAAAHLGVSL
jgi:hypothetical protein